MKKFPQIFKLVCYQNILENFQKYFKPAAPKYFSDFLKPFMGSKFLRTQIFLDRTKGSFINYVTPLGGEWVLLGVTLGHKV